MLDKRSGCQREDRPRPARVAASSLERECSLIKLSSSSWSRFADSPVCYASVCIELAVSAINFLKNNKLGWNIVSMRVPGSEF